MIRFAPVLLILSFLLLSASALHAQSSVPVAPTLRPANEPVRVSGP